MVGGSPHLDGARSGGGDLADPFAGVGTPVAMGLLCRLDRWGSGSSAFALALVVFWKGRGS